MQRTLLIALATAVVTAGVAATATIVLTGGDDEVAVGSPSPRLTTPRATTEVVTPSPAPGRTTRPPATTPPQPTGTATATPRPTPVPAGSASDVDCGREPELCSDETGRMEVIDDALVSKSSSRSQTDYSGVPTVTMSWRIVRPDGQEAAAGNEVEALHVSVTVSNDTSKTFVFPKREVALDVMVGGTLYDRLLTTGEGFEMTPGSKMTASFERPIVRDGTYTWRAKTWHHEK